MAGFDMTSQIMAQMRSKGIQQHICIKSLYNNIITQTIYNVLLNGVIFLGA